MRGSTSVGYDQFETSPEAIEQELRPAVCERRLPDRLKTNYSIDDNRFLDDPTKYVMLLLIANKWWLQ